MGGPGGPWPPHFFGTLFARKDRDTLIEQSGSGYSNRAVTVFREECSKFLSYVCVVINKEI